MAIRRRNGARSAVNYLDSNLHAEILHTIRTDAEVYAEDAADAIIEPAERWTHLLYEGADRAMEALELARHRQVDIRYAANRASVGLAAGDGWEAARRGSGRRRRGSPRR